MGIRASECIRLRDRCTAPLLATTSHLAIPNQVTTNIAFVHQLRCCGDSVALAIRLSCNCQLAIMFVRNVNIFVSVKSRLLVICRSEFAASMSVAAHGAKEHCGPSSC